MKKIATFLTLMLISFLAGYFVGSNASIDQRNINESSEEKEDSANSANSVNTHLQTPNIVAKEQSKKNLNSAESTDSNPLVKDEVLDDKNEDGDENAEKIDLPKTPFSQFQEKELTPNILALLKKEEFKRDAKTIYEIVPVKKLKPLFKVLQGRYQGHVYLDDGDKWEIELDTDYQEQENGHLLGTASIKESKNGKMFSETTSNGANKGYFEHPNYPGSLFIESCGGEIFYHLFLLQNKNTFVGNAYRKDNGKISKVGVILFER